MNVYALPDGTVTSDPAIAAEEWSKAFYKAKYAIARIRPVPSLILNELPVRDLDETIAECDAVLSLGEN